MPEVSDASVDRSVNESYVYGSSVTITCATGYQVNDSDVFQLNCSQSGEWIPLTDACMRKLVPRYFDTVK